MADPTNTAPTKSTPAPIATEDLSAESDEVELELECDGSGSSSVGPVMRAAPTATPPSAIAVSATGTPMFVVQSVADSDRGVIIIIEHPVAIVMSSRAQMRISMLAV